MAITFIGAGAAVVDDVTVQTTGTTFSPNASTLTNDLMLLPIGQDDDQDAWDDPPAAGWALLAQKGETSGRDYRLALAYKIATSDSEGSVTVTGTNTSTNIEKNGAILTYRGVDTTNPFDVVYVEANHYLQIQNAQNPSIHTYPLITTTTDGAMVIVVEHLGNVGVSDSQDPAGYTNALRLIGNSTGNVQAWHKEVAVAGDETPGAAGYAVSATTGDGGAFVIALRPATGGADITDPVISNQTFNFSENQIADATIGTVIATDDTAVTSFIFTVSGTQTSSDGFFNIDNSGVITITASGVASVYNDFETGSNSVIHSVTAGDAALNTASANITLNVTDINDLSIDSQPTAIIKNGSGSFQISNVTTTPTTGNTTITANSGADSLTVTSITGTGPYTINFNCPANLSMQNDTTGDIWTLTIDAETVNSTTIPLNPESGWDYINIDYTLVDVLSNDSVYFGDDNSQSGPLDGGQYVYESITTPGSIAITAITDEGYVQLPSVPTQDETFDGYLIESDGTIGTTNTFTIQAGETSITADSISVSSPVILSNPSITFDAGISSNSLAANTFTESVSIGVNNLIQPNSLTALSNINNLVSQINKGIFPTSLTTISIIESMLIGIKYSINFENLLLTSLLSDGNLDVSLVPIILDNISSNISIVNLQAILNASINLDNISSQFLNTSNSIHLNNGINSQNISTQLVNGAISSFLNTNIELNDIGLVTNTQSININRLIQASGNDLNMLSLLSNPLLNKNTNLSISDVLSTITIDELDVLVRLITTLMEPNSINLISSSNVININRNIGLIVNSAIVDAFISAVGVNSTPSTYTLSGDRTVIIMGTARAVILQSKNKTTIIRG